MIAVGPIKQAFVRALRDIDDLKSAVGSAGIDEGVSPPDSSYPRVVYSLASYAPDRAYGSEGIGIATIDCWAVSDIQVVANSLDQLMLDGLENVSLDYSDIDAVDGNEPSTLLCRRLLSLSLVELDDAGNRVFRVGGTYQIWNDRI